MESCPGSCESPTLQSIHSTFTGSIWQLGIVPAVDRCHDWPSRNRLAWSSQRKRRQWRPVDGDPRAVALCRDDCIPWVHVDVIPDGTVFEEGVRRSRKVETYPAATPRLGQSIDASVPGMSKRLDWQGKTKPSNTLNTYTVQ